MLVPLCWFSDLIQRRFYFGSTFFGSILGGFGYPNKYFEVTYRPNVLADPPRLMPRHSQAITGKPPEGMKPAPTGLPYLSL